MFQSRHEPRGHAKRGSGLPRSRRALVLLAVAAAVGGLVWMMSGALPNYPGVISPTVSYKCKAVAVEGGAQESGKYPMCCATGAVPRAPTATAQQHAQSCTVEFVGYEPSAYEQAWEAAVAAKTKAARMADLATVCGMLLAPAEVEATEQWLGLVQQLSPSGFVSADAPALPTQLSAAYGIGTSAPPPAPMRTSAASATRTPPSEADVAKAAMGGTVAPPVPATALYSARSIALLSRMRYRATCGEGTYEWTELLEPLHPMARNPTSLYHLCCSDAFRRTGEKGPQPYCAPERLADTQRVQDNLAPTYGNSRADASTLDASYILFQSARQSTFPLQHAGARNLLFDAGTGHFTTSLRWILCHFENERGIQFDEVYGWEFTTQDQGEYWDRLPPQFRNSMHFHNMPVTDKKGDRHNPVERIRMVAKPRDYVVFKLDIDTPALELSLLLQVLDDPATAALVDELMFEYHFRDPLMRLSWGERPDTADIDSLMALKLFSKARKLGIRMHFWP